MSICRGGGFTRRTLKQNGFADLLLPLTGFRFFAGFPSGPFLTYEKRFPAAGFELRNT
jgi:hypothetical protein